MDGGGERQRSPAASRGQTETIATVLILAMTLIGATVALAFGATALDNARISSQEGGIEQAMTQLDSRAAMVGLGDSDTQQVPLGATASGGYHVDPDAGWINVTHHGWNGTTDDEVIYNESLGALVYERDDVTIAYQGGGVWRSTDGNSTMISPPEFHYQSATLTLPVLQIAGSGSAAGSGVVAEITQVTRANPVYPNLSRDYPSSSKKFANPVREGNVSVTVHSDYYQAWAEYFRTRTTGEVTVDHGAQTAHVKLVSQGTVGSFQMPAEGNSIELRGLASGHPITDFNITIRPDDSDAASFSNLQWTLYADQGSQEFELHLRDGGPATDVGPCSEREVDVTIYYSDKNGDPYHGWHQDDAFVTGCDDLDGDGDSEIFLTVNLTGTTQLTMDSLSQSELQHFGTNGDDLIGTANFSEHGDEGVSWEDPGKEFTSGDSTTIGNLTNHYLSLMGPNVELTVEDASGNTINEEASTGHFEQTGGAGSFITFLHITENQISIEFE